MRPVTQHSSTTNAAIERDNNMMSSRLLTSRTEACRVSGGEEETQGLLGSNVTEDNKGTGEA